ncbi:MAG TPA: nucleotide exchange factor GrpE [Draconibacterium sp.]|nr:nucleotide exchange factor GrpE [Draconibacterium sp.]
MAEEKIKKEKEANAENAEHDKNTISPEEINEDSSLEDETEEEVSEKEGKKKKSKKEKKDAVIEELMAKLEELSDKHLRLQAEFDNFRRRTLKEKADLIKSGGETVLVNILPIVDDFERALESLKEVHDNDAGKQGTKLIYNKFVDFLKQNNVKEIIAQNQDFDVDLHEAITKIPVPDKELKGKVVDVIQKGYLLNDKVIRFAKVVIGE